MRISDWSSDVCSSDLAWNNAMLVRSLRSSHVALKPASTSFVFSGAKAGSDPTRVFQPPDFAAPLVFAYRKMSSVACQSRPAVKAGKTGIAAWRGPMHKYEMTVVSAVDLIKKEKKSR